MPEVKKGRGRPVKKAVAVAPPVKAVEPKPEEAKPKYKPMRSNSRRTKLKFRSVPDFRTITGFRSIKRYIAILLLFGMIISMFSIASSAIIYVPIMMVNGLILLDYIWMTRAPKSEKEAVHLKTGAELLAEKEEN